MLQRYIKILMKLEEITGMKIEHTDLIVDDISASKWFSHHILEFRVASQDKAMEAEQVLKDVELDYITIKYKDGELK